jgi:hypothetical protein
VTNWWLVYSESMLPKELILNICSHDGDMHTYCPWKWTFIHAPYASVPYKIRSIPYLQNVAYFFWIPVRVISPSELRVHCIVTPFIWLPIIFHLADSELAIQNRITYKFSSCWKNLHIRSEWWSISWWTYSSYLDAQCIMNSATSLLS